MVDIELTNKINRKIRKIHDLYTEYEDITVITNYDVAKQFLESSINMYDDEKNGCYSLKLDCEVELYIISIVKDCCFIIEPLLHDGKYYYLRCNNLIIDDDIKDEITSDFYDNTDYENKIILKELVDNESESESEILLDDFINEKALLFNDLHCDVKGILREIYNIGFQDGKNEMGLKVEKLVDEEIDI